MKELHKKEGGRERERQELCGRNLRLRKDLLPAQGHANLHQPFTQPFAILLCETCGYGNRNQ